RMGIALDELRGLRRPLVRVCLDWTERREHVAGSLGAAIASQALERGWIARRRGLRAVRVTPAGLEALRAHLGLRLDGTPAPRVAVALVRAEHGAAPATLRRGRA